jgi:hypothetical protein
VIIPASRRRLFKWIYNLNSEYISSIFRPPRLFHAA